jgi:hypothetical protein
VDLTRKNIGLKSVEFSGSPHPVRRAGDQHVIGEKMMKRRVTMSVFIATICLLLSSVAFSEVPYPEQTLPTGRTVKVDFIIKEYRADIGSALVFRYYTDYDISDNDALRREVDDIWQSFMIVVEEAGLKAAVISAREILPKGIIRKTKARDFVFIKQEDGLWRSKK